MVHAVIWPALKEDLGLKARPKPGSKESQESEKRQKDGTPRKGREHAAVTTQSTN